MSKFFVVFDVDSTLIEDEVIELLAEVAGRREEVAAVTERAMAGELDFAESLIQRVATLEGLPEKVFKDVLQRIRITPGAKELIHRIHEAGGRVGAVSGGFTQVLTPLADELGLDFARANDLEVVDGKLSGRVLGQIVDKSVKAQSLLEWAERISFKQSQTVAVGDGANDLEMMTWAGLSVAFNAKPIVKASADIVIEKQNLLELADILGV
ncbi:MAG: phosphoserine phosphatase SerB [Actinomycetales bacterium]|nr:phosphoserine phosphatase SerB [Actinomycetales bacterium]